MKTSFYAFFSTAYLLLSCLGLSAQKVRTVSWTTITDESHVPVYSLPDPLQCKDGSIVTTLEQWESIRRPELLDMLTTYMYGKTPDADHLGYETLAYEPRLFEGIAVRKIIRIYLTKEGNRGPCVEAFIYTPAVQKSVPAFMLFNIPKDEDILRLLHHGYGVVCFKNTEAAADNMEAFTSGVIPAYYRKGQTCPYPDEWGSIAAWAWTASRVMDYLEVDNDVDETKVAIHGHSRLGKTALWAGASDRRFAMVFPAGSGCCGAALSRRMFGETLFNANVAFPHWFCGNFQQFSMRENLMPFDQHEVIALCAPRPVYIAAGEDDSWADPKGEYLSGRAANPVYSLYGEVGLAAAQWPEVDKPSQEGLIAYHVRKGGHTVNEYDWEKFIEFADKYLKSGKDIIGKQYKRRSL